MEQNSRKRKVKLFSGRGGKNPSMQMAKRKNLEGGKMKSNSSY